MYLNKMNNYNKNPYKIQNQLKKTFLIIPEAIKCHNSTNLGYNWQKNKEN